jgi:hypothetical protein
VGQATPQGSQRHVPQVHESGSRLRGCGVDILSLPLLSVSSFPWHASVCHMAHMGLLLPVLYVLQVQAQLP